ncbi:MAG: hypothetical protein ACR2LX_02515 [Jatrophihabitans sp.]
MHPIPRPELLDADRTKSHYRDEMSMLDQESRAERLDDALHASCAYATELWQHLDAVRGYLYDSLPSDPRAPGDHPHACASPTGADDEPGWQRWIDTFATATSILAGPHGDSGFGLSEANKAARARREAPNLKVLGKAAAVRTPAHAGSHPSATPAVQPTREDAKAPRSDPKRLVGLALLTILAVRGLRPRRAHP